MPYGGIGGFLSAAPLPETHRMIGRSSRLALISGRTAIFGFVHDAAIPQRQLSGGDLNRSTQHFILGGKDQL
jgi:hypothetical protein